MRVFALQHLGVAFRYWYGVGSHDDISGLYHTAYTLAVYASQSGVDLRSTQDSLPAGGPPFAGRATISRVPLGSIVRFRCQFITSHFLLTQTRAARHVVLHFLAHTNGLFGGTTSQRASSARLVEHLGDR